MNVALIGCGYIGRKRLHSLRKEDRLVGVADSDAGRARELAAKRNDIRIFSSWEDAVRNPEVEAVLVAVTNNWLAPITLAAVRNGKHVLVEKPAARYPDELAPVLGAAREQKVCVQVGFNHRYHPAMQKAREIVDSGQAGPLMFIRGRYGHGGRIGYDKEWRADPETAGGGELLDQGSHLIDLSRWFLGDFAQVEGNVATMFWDMEVEDNGFLTLRTDKNQIAWLHASCSEWKNMYSFEIYGRNAKLQIDGLGGSYGVERLSFYRMLPEMGPPHTTIWEYPRADTSWRSEYEAFCRCVKTAAPPLVGLSEAMAVLKIVHRIYKSAGFGYAKPHTNSTHNKREDAR